MRNLYRKDKWTQNATKTIGTLEISVNWLPASHKMGYGVSISPSDYADWLRWLNTKGSEQRKALAARIRTIRAQKLDILDRDCFAGRIGDMFKTAPQNRGCGCDSWFKKLNWGPDEVVFQRLNVTFKMPKVKVAA